MAFNSPGDNRDSSSSQRMHQRMGNQPMIVLSEESQRTSGRDAQKMNITAGRAMAEAVRTTLGPKGLDKMLVDRSGDVVVTNDGVTILEEMDVDHPAASMITEVGLAQKSNVGDGATTAITIAGELLHKAEDLLDQDIHPTAIIKGYQVAAAKATSILEAMARTVEYQESLVSVAETAMWGKGAEAGRETLAEHVVDAVLSVSGHSTIKPENIAIETVVGKPVKRSKLIPGVVVQEEPAVGSIPQGLKDVDLALFDGDVDVPELQAATDVTVTDPEQLEKFIDRETQELDAIATDLTTIDVDVVVTSGEVHDRVRSKLAAANVLVIEDVDESSLRQLAHGTTADIVSPRKSIKESDLGTAESVRQVDIRGDTAIVFSGSDEASAVTFKLCGSNAHTVAEVKRAVEDAIRVVVATLNKPQVVPGGGAPEIAVAAGVREFATTLDGREQLAAEAFADAIETIPRSLASNAGYDPIDTLVELRSHHDRGNTTAGIDAETGDIVNMEARGVTEPLLIKTSAIEKAREASTMVIRIDDIIASEDMSGGSVDETETTKTGGMGGFTQSRRWHEADVSIADLKKGERKREPTDKKVQTETKTGELVEEDSIDSGKITTVTTPTWISALQEFPLEVRWEGVLEELRVITGNPFDVVDMVGASADSATTHGKRTIISSEEIGKQNGLLIELEPVRIPEHVKETTEISLVAEFTDGTVEKTTTDLTLLRPKLEVRVTDEVTLGSEYSGVDIELTNTGEMRTSVEITAKANDKKIHVTRDLSDKLLEGFLNIGLHERSDADIAPAPDIDPATRRLLRESCKTVLEKLQTDRPEPPSIYDETDLDALAEVLQSLLSAEVFGPLKPYIDDIELTYLHSSVEMQPAETVELASPVKELKIPPEASEITIEIQYFDSQGRQYDNIERTVRINRERRQTSHQTMDLDLRALDPHNS